MRCVAVLGGLVLASSVGACTTVPTLNVDGISISEIVQRVKCEIALAVPEPQPPWPTGPYQWMRSWTAKVDLTLTTNAQSAITPSVVLTKFLPSVPVANVGNISQLFTFGVGGGISTTAIRTEILSFTVSLAELRGFKRQGICAAPEGMDLYGNLGLQEWVASAVTPVNLGQLKVGRHPSPGSKSLPAPPVIPPIELKGVTADPLAKLRQFTANVQFYASAAEKALAAAKINGARDDIQSTYDDAATIYGAVKAADIEFDHVQTEARQLLADSSNKDNTTEINALVTDARAAGARAATAKKSVDTIIEALPHDPPIDSLSHSVQFIVGLTGNATPNWTLVNFKGPGAGGSFASGSSTTTHTLNIVMGSPAALPAEQDRQLNNLVIIQTLGQKP